MTPNTTTPQAATIRERLFLLIDAIDIENELDEPDDDAAEATESRLKVALFEARPYGRLFDAIEQATEEEDDPSGRLFEIAIHVEQYLN